MGRGRESLQKDHPLARRAAEWVGRSVEVLIDAPGVARSFREAPEIDGVVRVEGGRPGEYRTVTVSEAWGTELTA